MGSKKQVESVEDDPKLAMLLTFPGEFPPNTKGRAYLDATPEHRKTINRLDTLQSNIDEWLRLYHGNVILLNMIRESLISDWPYPGQNEAQKKRFDESLSALSVLVDALVELDTTSREL